MVNERLATFAYLIGDGNLRRAINTIVSHTEPGHVNSSPTSRLYGLCQMAGVEGVQLVNETQMPSGWLGMLVNNQIRLREFGNKNLENKIERQELEKGSTPSMESLSALTPTEKFYCAHEAAHLLISREAPSTSAMESYFRGTQLGQNPESCSKLGREELVCDTIASRVVGPSLDDTISSGSRLTQLLSDCCSDEYRPQDVLDNLAERLHRPNKREHLVGLAWYANNSQISSKRTRQLSEPDANTELENKYGMTWRFAPLYGGSFWARWFACRIPFESRCSSLLRDAKFGSPTWLKETIEMFDGLRTKSYARHLSPPMQLRKFTGSAVRDSWMHVRPLYKIENDKTITYLRDNLLAPIKVDEQRGCWLMDFSFEQNAFADVVRNLAMRISLTYENATR